MNRTVAGFVLAIGMTLACRSIAGPAEELAKATAAYDRGEYASAVGLLRPSADQGYAPAQVRLGLMYARGHGVPRDDAEAVRWYRKAAETGYAWGQTNLGYMYAQGRGVARDDIEAVQWYRKAAEQDFAVAQDNLGVMYRDGRGVAQDHVAAVDWFRKAAEQGNAVAQNNLGVMYESGRGVAQDEVTAAQWYRRAADQGQSLARNNLGRTYAQGRGMSANDAETVTPLQRITRISGDDPPYPQAAIEAGVDKGNVLAPTQPLAQAPTEARAIIPVADFFRTPRLDKPKLSANGRYLAAGMAVEGGRVQLAIWDLENLGQSKVVAGFRDADIDNYDWVNEQRVVFDAIDLQSGTGTITPLAPGLWAVNRDGSEFRQLINASRAYGVTNRASHVSDRKLPWEWRLHSVLTDGSNDVLVQGLTLNSVGDVVDTNLARLDTTTGVTKNLSEGAPRHVTSWVVDREGRPAALTTLYEGRFQSYLKSTADTGWDRWQDAAALGGRYAVPYWVGFDRQLLALGRVTDDASAVYAVDATTRKLIAEPVVSLKGYDFRGSIVYDTQARRLLGVHFETDARSTGWLDPSMQATQAAVDALLPATNNRIDCQRCLSVPTMLVTAASDRQPPVYYLYNRDTRALTLISTSRPWIKAQAMGRRDVHRFAARDGLSIPVLVTQPPSKANGARPAVILVHGGPWVRGTHWEWEPAAQFLASRGYVVIEPEFRGSQGYGFNHFRAGWKQWGLAMQDDVADATNWAVKQGWVDPNRVCIAGASYGGYATLMGLVRYHELYQCGIDWVGVTDINLMYSINWSDTSEETKGYRLPVLIGDKVTDAKLLKDTSPLEQAAKVRRPLLMAYGGADWRVPIEHGKEFRDAVSRTNKDIEWIVYLEEGHGWRTLETQVDFWTRVEKFLERHLRMDAK